MEAASTRGLDELDWPQAVEGGIWGNLVIIETYALAAERAWKSVGKARSYKSSSRSQPLKLSRCPPRESAGFDEVQINIDLSGPSQHCVGRAS